MVDMLYSKISEAGITNMTALKTDILGSDGSGRDAVRFTLPQDKYDVIYTSMALHHVVDVSSALSVFFSLLSDGGTVCIVDLTQDDGSFHRLEKDFNGHNGFEQEELRIALKNKGFTDVHTRMFFEDTKRIEDRDVPYSLFIMTGSKPAGRAGK
jgi:SAM-dependent methyltransferase